MNERIENLTKEKNELNSDNNIQNYDNLFNEFTTKKNELTSDIKNLELIENQYIQNKKDEEKKLIKTMKLRKNN